MTEDKSEASSRIAFQEYVTGAELPDGTIIDYVFSKGRNYVIFQRKGRRSISYKWKALKPEQRTLISKFESLEAKAQRKFRGAHFNDFNPLLISTLRAVFQDANFETTTEAFCELENYINVTGEVKAVIAQTTEFVVWLDDRDMVRYHCNAHLVGVEHSIAEYTRLKALGISVLPDSSKKHFFRQLGASLASALRLKPGPETVNLFQPIEDLIQSILENHLRIKYLALTSISACLLIWAAFVAYQFNILHDFLHGSLVGVSGGFLGAMISVLERSKTLHVAVSESPSLIVFHGTMRIVLGGAFGFIAFAAAKSGLAFSILNTTNAALLLLGIVAGFSERLIPELIQSISTKTDET